MAEVEAAAADAGLSFYTPGVRGIIALPVMAALGQAIGMSYVRSHGGMHPLGKVAENAILLCVMSGFFWCWAVYKVVTTGDRDWGAVTFLIAFVAAFRTADLCVVHIARRSGRLPKGKSPLLRMQTLLPAACFLVMGNYLGVLVFVGPRLPLLVQTYLGLGTITWSLSAIRGGWLLGEYDVVTYVKDEEKKARRQEREGLLTSSRPRGLRPTEDVLQSMGEDAGL